MKRIMFEKTQAPFSFVGLTLCIIFAAASHADTVFVEAEQFEDHGGWVLDQQFMDLMGSPFLLAHGMATPVQNTTTKVKFESPGTYRV
jgi:hypothetical protein